MGDDDGEKFVRARCRKAEGKSPLTTSSVLRLSRISIIPVLPGKAKRRTMISAAMSAPKAAALVMPLPRPVVRG